MRTHTILAEVAMKARTLLEAAIPPVRSEHLRGAVCIYCNHAQALDPEYPMSEQHDADCAWFQLWDLMMEES